MTTLQPPSVLSGAIATATPVASPTQSRIVQVDVVTSPVVKSRKTRQRKAITSLIAFALFMLVSHQLLVQGMDRWYPILRDPEYGRRLARYKALVGKQSHPFTLVTLGSSRTGFGLRPEVLARTHPEGPRVFNFSILGSGPVMQVMTLRRLLAENVPIDGIVMEYWPAFLRGDGRFAEDKKIDPHRLLPVDRPFIRDYYEDPDLAEATMKHVRKVVWYEHRGRILSQLVPTWLPWTSRLDTGWDRMDRWGWMPGIEDKVTPPERYARVQYSKLFYKPLFDEYQISPKANQAIREIVTLCRERNIPLVMVWLPESTEFREWATVAEPTFSEHARWVRDDLGVTLLDCRDWVPDTLIPDGFHLSQHGAEVFTQKLGDHLPALFPQARVSTP